MSVQRRSTQRGTVYDVRLRDPDGRVYTRTFPTKRQAAAFEAAERADRRRGNWIDPRHAETSFAEWATLWLRSNPAKRSSSLAREESIVRVHLLPALGQRPLGAITPRDVQALVVEWSGRAQPRTVRRQYGLLRTILAAAVNADLIARSPCRGIRLPAAEPETRRVLSPDDLAALAEAIGPDLEGMVYLGAVLGLRWGECAGLRVGRIDFLAGTLVVAEQLTRGLGGVMVAGPPKSTAGRRTLTVPGPLLDLLAAHLARRGLTGADPDAYVFVGPAGEPLDYANFRHRTWLPAIAAAGLDGLTFHDLRRTNATGMVQEGVDLKTAQSRLGHSDPRLTLGLYAQVTSEADRTAAERLGARFMPSRATPSRASRAMNARWTFREPPGAPVDNALTRANPVGKAGFEPATSASRTLRANQAALLPVVEASAYCVAAAGSSSGTPSWYDRPSRAAAAALRSRNGSSGFTSHASAPDRLARNTSAWRSSRSTTGMWGSRPPLSSWRRARQVATPPMVPTWRSSTTRSGTR